MSQNENISFAQINKGFGATVSENMKYALLMMMTMFMKVRMMMKTMMTTVAAQRKSRSLMVDDLLSFDADGK